MPPDLISILFQILQAYYQTTSRHFMLLEVTGQLLRSILLIKVLSFHLEPFFIQHKEFYCQQFYLMHFYYTQFKVFDSYFRLLILECHRISFITIVFSFYIHLFHMRDLFKLFFIFIILLNFSVLYYHHLNLLNLENHHHHLYLHFSFFLYRIKDPLLL